MIKIELNLGVAIYVGASLIILVIWFLFEGKRKLFQSTGSTLWQCPICYYDYIDSLSEKISECPRCKSLHKKDEKQYNKKQENEVEASTR